MANSGVHVLDHPLIQHKLTRLRDADTPPDVFRAVLAQIAGLMVFEISQDLPLCDVQVQTPLEITTSRRLGGPVTVVPILRAGIGMSDGITRLMPEARTGHIGLYRNEDTLQPVEYYCKLPDDIADGPVFLVDPMLATGGSAIAAIEALQQRGCSDVRFVCLVASPEGVVALTEACADVPVYTAAIDRQLNEVGYILPGLGDAGDRVFGTR
ncbi:MAG: uracil phosphoribosyltransferase [Phycisphaerales bacterium]|nr:uracil phosphoribosyltransferase [Phycisphaerales bacterium]